MDANKTVLIFILILVMCMGSAGIAMRKLVDADPAEIFWLELFVCLKPLIKKIKIQKLFL